MRRTYYNTTGVTGDELDDYQNRALSQDERLLAWFRANPRAKPIASELVLAVFLNRCPITSVRRSLNTLMNEGYIQKLDEQRRTGDWRRPEHCWRLVRRQLDMF